MRVRSIYLKTRFRKKSMITNLFLLSRLKSSQNPRYRNYTLIHMWRSVKEESEIKRRNGILDYRLSIWMTMILDWFSIPLSKTVISKNKKLETNLHMILFTRIHHDISTGETELEINIYFSRMKASGLSGIPSVTPNLPKNELK